MAILPFPLLRLPFLALKESLKCLNPIELFTLSQCSTIATEAIKLAGTREFKLSVDFGNKTISIKNTYWFDILKSDDCDEYDFKMKRCDTFVVKDVKMSVPVAIDLDIKNILYSLWDDTFIGMRATCFHLIHIFGCKIDYLETGDYLSFESFESIIGEILEKQHSIPTLFIYSVELTDSDLKWVLDTVKVTKQLMTSVKLSGNFEYNFMALPEILIIYHSSWLARDNLLSLNSCKVIELYGSNLTNKDLDVFICLWKTGKLRKLEYLEVESDKLNDNEMIAGLTSMRNTLNPTRREKRVNKNVYAIQNGVDIQRDDGIMATIKLDAVRGYFEFLVWTN